MSERNAFEKPMRLATIIVLAVVIVVAPLVGVYAFSPLFFVWGVEPYQLAVTLAVMLSETLAIALLAWLVIRSRK